MAGIRQRSNILSLPLAEVTKLTNAFKVLKSNGVYDEFIRRHMTAMMTPTPVGSQSNAAHCGPIFLPWHRAALWELESNLLAVDPTIAGLPYWQWENEAALNGGDPTRSILWTDAYFGTDGDPTKGNRVLNGPFKDWHAFLYNNATGTFVVRASTGLVRRLGRDPAGAPTLPDQTQITDVNTFTTYDIAPFNKNPNSFRNRMEGWSAGPRMHNQVHRWVGGDMLTGTSPNDPVFWLHHGNVDRIWWLWQNASTPLRPYLPAATAVGPIGQRAGDTMSGHLRSDWTPAAVQDIQNTTNLGYQYL